MARTKKPSTVERWLRKPGFKDGVQKEYKKLMLTELVLAIMAADRKSVRQLACELGVSKTVIQNLRSGEQTDMKLSNFVKRYLVLGDEILAVAELQPKPDGGGGVRVDPAGRAAVAGAEAGGGLKSLARNAKDEAEAEAISRALEETNWNRKQAAVLLKISYKALLYKIRQYGCFLFLTLNQL